jgi:RNA polymerase sigma factor for flagellar operon FliA
MAQVSRRDALVEQHLRLIRPIALSIYSKLPAHTITMEDLEQMGSIGLMAAAERCDQRRKHLFTSYARAKIRGAMLDGIRDWIAESMHQAEIQVEMLDLPGANEDPETAAARAERDGALLRAVQDLPARQRLVIEMRFRDGLTQRATAAALGGVSQANVAALEGRGIRSLRQRLAA